MPIPYIHVHEHTRKLVKGGFHEPQEPPLPRSTTDIYDLHTRMNNVRVLGYTLGIVWSEGSSIIGSF